MTLIVSDRAYAKVAPPRSRCDCDGAPARSLTRNWSNSSCNETAPDRTKQRWVFATARGIAFCRFPKPIALEDRNNKSNNSLARWDSQDVACVENNSPRIGRDRRVKLPDAYFVESLNESKRRPNASRRVPNGSSSSARRHTMMDLCRAPRTLTWEISPSDECKRQRNKNWRNVDRGYASYSFRVA